MIFASSTKPQKLRPQTPANVRVYAVGDVHGRADLLADIFARIDASLRAYPVANSIEVFLGDYVDRGPDSRGVLDLLVARKSARRTVFLKGNHESIMLDFLSNPAVLRDWQRLGGLETLMSYGIAASLNADAAVQAAFSNALSHALPESHREFLAGMKTSFACGDYFFVHAGVRPGVPLDMQREDDLLWIRSEFLDSEDDFGKFVVHGHTPVTQPDVRANRVNIDTGAYASGLLTCLALEGDEMGLI